MNPFLIFVIIVVAISALENLGTRSIPVIRKLLDDRYKLKALRETHRLTDNNEDIIASMMLDRELAHNFHTRLGNKLDQEKTRLLEDKRAVSDAEEVTSET
jgi:hypothetical protein